MMNRGNICSATLPPDTELKDFRIICLLEQDNLGALYRAEHCLLGQEVALREFVPAHCAVLSPESFSLSVLPGMEAALQAAYDGFLANLRLWSKLQHPALPGLQTAFSGPTGTVYAVMMPEEGEPLFSCVSAHKGNEKTLRPLLCQALEALDYLYGKELLPDNLTPECFLVQGDKLRLALFGKLRSSKQPGAVVSRSDYASLEELRGNAPGSAAVIYSLGAVLYHAICGQLPMPAPQRLGKRDGYEPLAGRAELQSRYSDAFLSSIDKALSLWVEDRWPDFAAWLAGMDAPAAVVGPGSAGVPGGGLRLGGGTLKPGATGLKLGGASASSGQGLKLGSSTAPAGQGIALGGSTAPAGQGFALGGSTAPAGQGFKLGGAGVEEENDDFGESSTPVPQELLEAIMAACEEEDEDDDGDLSFLDDVDYDSLSADEAYRLLSRVGIAPEDYLEQLPYYLDDIRILHLMLITGMNPSRDEGNYCPILDVIEHGTLEGLALCLKYGADVNKYYPRLMTTALHTAIDSDSIPCLEMLVKAGARLDLEGFSQDAPLEYAAIDGKVEIVEWLIKAGADVNRVDDYGTHVLEKVNDEECRRILVAAGSHFEEPEETPAEPTDLNTVDFDDIDEVQAALLLAERKIAPADYAEALLKAVCEGDVNLVKVLLAAGADPEGDGDNYDYDSPIPLYHALERASADAAFQIVEALLDAGMNVDLDMGGEGPLDRAVYAENEKVIKLLIDRGADVNMGYKEGGVPLHAAVIMDSPKLLEMLYRAGADLEAVDSWYNTPLQFAARRGRAKALRWLIDAGAKLDVSDEDGAHVLDVTSDEECLRMLKDAGCAKGSDEDEDEDDSDGLSEEDAQLSLARRDISKDDYAESLLDAAAEGDVNLMKLLLAAGADPEGDGNNYGREHAAPFYIASSYLGGDTAVEVTRTLLDAGMNVDQDLGYESPLMRSIYDSNPKVAKLLIDRGADVNIGFGEGGRPLHAAVDVNDPMYLEMLTDAGADLEYWDEFGNTPLQYAARHGKLDALCWLINAGAELNVSDEYGDHVLDVTEDEDCLNALREAGCCKVEEDEEEEAEDAPSADEPDAEEKVAFLLGKLAESFGVPAAAEPDIWEVLEEGKVSQLKQCLDSFGDVNRLVKKNGRLFSLVAYAVVNTPTPSLAGCINVLKAAGADMNVRLEDGITALHLAAASNNLEAICALLEAGADSNLKDDSGSAPIAYATDVDCIVRL